MQEGNFYETQARSRNGVRCWTPKVPAAEVVGFISDLRSLVLLPVQFHRALQMAESIPLEIKPHALNTRDVWLFPYVYMEAQDALDFSTAVNSCAPADCICLIHAVNKKLLSLGVNYADKLSFPNKPGGLKKKIKAQKELLFIFPC